MQLASEMAPGGMATVIYSADSNLKKAIEKAKEWCLERGINEPECRVATYLHPNMKVIAGHTEVSLASLLINPRLILKMCSICVRRKVFT